MSLPWFRRYLSMEIFLGVRQEITFFFLSCCIRVSLSSFGAGLRSTVVASLSQESEAPGSVPVPAIFFRFPFR